MAQLQTAAIAAFRCLGDACPDTCCRGWSMQLDAPTEARYAAEAPELLAAVQPMPVPPGSVLPAAIMRRDPETDVCVKFAEGWCGIHRDYGASFLGDACHFYPRILRGFGPHLTMTATLSCPETARLMLAEETSLAWEPAAFDRLPSGLRDYAQDGLEGEAALALQEVFLNGAAMAAGPKQAVLQLHSAAQSLEGFPRNQWPDMGPMAWQFAASRIPNAETHPADIPNLLLALCGLMQAAGKGDHARLRPLTARIESLLACEVAWDGLRMQVTPHTGIRLAALGMRAEMLPWLGPFLLRWLRAELNAAAFPFAGLGATLTDKAVILGVRMATLTLALLARADEADFGPEAAVAETQTLARFLDHLAEPEYSMQIYRETGWHRPARLRGLLEALGVR